MRAKFVETVAADIEVEEESVVWNGDCAQGTEEAGLEIIKLGDDGEMVQTV